MLLGISDGIPWLVFNCFAVLVLVSFLQSSSAAPHLKKNNEVNTKLCDTVATCHVTHAIPRTRLINAGPAKKGAKVPH